MDSRETFRQLLRDGQLDDRKVEIELPADRGGNVIQLDSQAPVNVTELFGRMGKLSGKRPTEKKNLPIKEAMPLIEEVELEKLLDMTDITKEAIQAVEESGIVFIDEIDKVSGER
jgi:ATP-dependent HslUV protease ATP-binding subunit HslU